MIWLSIPALAAPLSLPSGAGSSAVSLASRGDRLEMVWLQPTGGTPAVLHAVHEGEGWSSPSVVARSDALFVNWADTPVLGHAGDGSSVVTYPRKSGEGTYAYDVVVSRWSGKQWVELGSPHRDGTETEHGFPSVVADGAGFRVFWLDGRLTADAGPMTLRTARWDGTFEASELLDDRVCDCCGTDAVGGATDWAIVYRDRSEDEIRDIGLVNRSGEKSRVAGDGWQMPGCPVNGPRVLDLPAGRVIAWTTGVSGLEVRASVGGGVGVVAPADDRPAGRVDLVSVGSEALVTWLGSDGIYARRLAAEPAGLLGGQPVQIAPTGSGRSTGFPRATVVGTELWTIWTVESGLVGERTPLASIPPVSAPLPAPGASMPRTSWDPKSLALKSLDDAPASLRLREPRTLVTTWASWCGPCRKELAALSAIHEAHPELDLQVIAVGDTSASVRQAAPAAPGTWRLGEREAVRQALGSDAVPRAWLLDDTGSAIWHHEGLITLEAVQAALSR